MADDDPNRGVHRTGGRKMTKQSESAATDINNIVKRVVREGVIPQRGDTPRYGDFSQGLDFHTALNRVQQAETDFMALNPHVRDFCGNDPAKFIDLVLDPDGRKQLQELGMLSDFAPPGAPEPTPEPTPEVETPATPKQPE